MIDLEIGEFFFMKNKYSKKLAYIGYKYDAEHACMFSVNPDQATIASFNWWIEELSNFTALKVDNDINLNRMIEYFQTLDLSNLSIQLDNWGYCNTLLNSIRKLILTSEGGK